MASSRLIPIREPVWTGALDCRTDHPVEDRVFEGRAFETVYRSPAGPRGMSLMASRDGRIVPIANTGR